MKRDYQLVSAIALGVFLTFNVVTAQANQISAESSEVNRLQKKLGLSVAFGDPAPTLLGVNLAYNPLAFMRVQVGMGSQTTSLTLSEKGLSESKATVVGIGTKFFVPDWNLTPTAGINLGYISYSGDGSVRVGGFNKNGTHIYSSFGFDWQTSSGFNIGAGYNLSFKGKDASGIYVNVGWFTDLLG